MELVKAVNPPVDSALVAIGLLDHALLFQAAERLAVEELGAQGAEVLLVESASVLVGEDHVPLETNAWAVTRLEVEI